MKREMIICLVLAVMIIPNVMAAPCNLNTKIINQDPYPAIPGEYVKLVFQVNNVDNPDCGEITLTLNETFPFTFDPGESRSRTIQSGTYARNFETSYIASYRVRVDNSALDGENPIDALLTRTQDNTVLTTFERYDITVENALADFEVSVKNYNRDTNILTLEILNIGEVDVEALTIEIPKQDNIIIKGANRNIVGNLDSNEDTTFTYEAQPQDGEIELRILYTDTTKTRRSVTKKITFDNTYFVGRAADAEIDQTQLYMILGLIALVIIILIRGYFVKRKLLRRHQR